MKDKLLKKKKFDLGYMMGWRDLFLFTKNLFNAKTRTDY